MPAHSRTPQRVYVVRRIAALAVVVLVAVLGTWAVSRALGSDPAAEGLVAVGDMKQDYKLRT